MTITPSSAFKSWSAANNCLQRIASLYTAAQANIKAYTLN